MIVHFNFSGIKEYKMHLPGEKYYVQFKIMKVYYLTRANALIAASTLQSIFSTRYETIRKPVLLKPWVQWIPIETK